MNIIIFFRSWMSKYVIKIINEPLLCIDKNKKLTISVYRKPTYSGVFTSFKSFKSIVYKLDLVYSLLNRCFNITFSYQKIYNEINALKQIFKHNGYPILFLDRCMKQFLQKSYVTKAIQDAVNKRQLLIFLPFLDSIFFSQETTTKLYKKQFTILFIKNHFSIQN